MQYKHFSKKLTALALAFAATSSYAGGGVGSGGTGGFASAILTFLGLA
jgi:hypothetical protein